MRRIWSVTYLTFREAVHSKVLLSCAVFAVMLVLVRLGVFAVGGREVRVNAEQFTSVALVLVLMTGIVATIVVAAPSLSQDIRTKVIHTIIPKPIHRVEILLGKVLGFGATAALILLIVGAMTLAVQLLTIPRRDPERKRDIFAAEVQAPPTSILFSGGYLSYMKRSDRRWLNPDVPETEADRQEREATGRGRPVPGRATVTFDTIRPRDLGGGPLRFEVQVGVYRFGGAAGEPAEVSIEVVNRTTGDRHLVGRRGPTDTEGTPFRLAENVPRRIEVPAAFIGDGARVDLIIRNLTYKHRIGIRRTDVMLLLGDRSYVLNFVKSLAILFLEVFLVVVIAVMSSTFLSGPIAILFTSVVWLAGHMMGWMSELVTRWGTTGEGPLAEISKEFGRTIYTPEGPVDWILDFANGLFQGVMWVAARLFPNLGQFRGAWLVTQNVDISAAMVWRAAQFCVLYSLVCFIMAYAAFRVKEVAR